jgi:hypothetical protein
MRAFLKVLLGIIFFNALFLQVLAAEVAKDEPVLKSKDGTKIIVTDTHMDAVAVQPPLRDFISSEVGKVNEAIRSLKKDTNDQWKEIFSYVLPFLSLLLGAAIGFFSFLYQERFKEKRDQLRTANKWILNGVDMFHSLERYKRVYSPKIGTNTEPVGRAMAIPELRVKPDEYPLQLGELVFLLGVDDAEWELMRIRALFSNFSVLNTLWSQHSNTRKYITERILQFNGGVSFSQIDANLLFRVIPHNELINHILLTEQAVRLTDDLIIECHKFMVELPALVKKRLKQGRFKIGTVVSVHKGVIIPQLLAPTIPVDMDRLMKFSGMSRESIEMRLATGYPLGSG